MFKTKDNVPLAIRKKNQYNKEVFHLQESQKKDYRLSLEDRYQFSNKKFNNMISRVPIKVLPDEIKDQLMRCNKNSTNRVINTQVATKATLDFTHIKMRQLLKLTKKQEAYERRRIREENEMKEAAR